MHLLPPAQRSGSIGSVQLPPEVIKVSADLFPGPFEVHWEADPEVPGESFLVITVSADGKPKDLVQRRREWHRRVCKLLPENDIRLCLTSTTA